jgi:Arc/MetJ-type ribon-helix-helix transcriptional regulator
METVKRITITIPKKDYDIIQEKYIKEGIFINIQDYIRDLIKKDLREKGFYD